MCMLKSNWIEETNDRILMWLQTVDRILCDQKFVNVYLFLNAIRYTGVRNIWISKEMFLFNDALNTFYLWLYGVKHDKRAFR